MIFSIYQPSLSDIPLSDELPLDVRLLRFIIGLIVNAAKLMLRLASLEENLLESIDIVDRFIDATLVRTT